MKIYMNNDLKIQNKDLQKENKNLKIIIDNNQYNFMSLIRKLS